MSPFVGIGMHVHTYSYWHHVDRSSLLGEITCLGQISVSSMEGYAFSLLLTAPHTCHVHTATQKSYTLKDY